MKKYKVLLSGKNTIVMDDFFQYTNDVFTVVTTSMRNYDILNHLDFFKPDVFIYCLNGDKREDLLRLTEYRSKFERDDIIFIIVGSEDECDNFQRIAINMAKLVLQKPITANGMKDHIIHYMEQVEAKKEEERQQQLALEEAAKCPRKHILVIDDDPLMLKLIKEYLHEQYDVATAINGKIARKFLENKHTDLILLDYEMPVENGPEVFHKIKDNPALAEIPIVFLTGVSDKDKIRQALMLKPQGYLLKPIEKDKLFTIIDKCI